MKDAELACVTSGIVPQTVLVIIIITTFPAGKPVS